MGQVYLPSIISAIDRSLQYFADNYMRMNLDAIFGLRVLEGSYHGLKVALWAENCTFGDSHVEQVFFVTVWSNHCGCLNSFLAWRE